MFIVLFLQLYRQLDIFLSKNLRKRQKALNNNLNEIFKNLFGKGKESLLQFHSTSLSKD